MGSPLARTTRTASATISPRSSPTPSGVTEKAMSMSPELARPPARAHPGPTSG
jgi:hypothetical protein